MTLCDLISHAIHKDTPPIRSADDHYHFHYHCHYQDEAKAKSGDARPPRTNMFCDVSSGHTAELARR